MKEVDAYVPYGSIIISVYSSMYCVDRYITMVRLNEVKVNFALVVY